MRTIPTELKADGTKIFARLGGLNMPLSEETIKKHCGHQPKTEMEAKVMARRLKGIWLEFPNINTPQQRKIKTLTGWRDNPDKVQERIEKRKRKERGVVKVTLQVKMESDYKDNEVGLALLKIEQIIKVQKISKTSLVFELKRVGVTQEIFEEKIYPQIKKDIPYVKEFEGHDFAD